MDAIRQRHDDALEQIGSKIRGAPDRAKSTTELRLNQTVPEYTGAALRPDIVLRNVNAKTMVIADLAVTFEDHATRACHSSLQLSHDHKTLKYQPIVAELRHKGWRVETAAIVYGSLGSVQPSTSKRTQRSSSFTSARLDSWISSCQAIAFVPATASGAGTAGATANTSGAALPRERRVGLGGGRGAHRRHRHGDKLVIKTDRALHR
ncbi:unnamed protein product [Phytophthora lilii]|uniref:Unnamed protein product n=1 Tax=Phytophthora lilii TaxID=2077276 RepID=A0A9W6XP78_9STRA|nr:unnamed protein product [Phytophthora lilii]